MYGNICVAYLLYNTHLAWASRVAYLDGKAMRRPDDWDKRQKFLPRLFFMSITEVLTFNAESRGTGRLND